MRLLFIADGRSPTALNWMRHFIDADHEVHLLTTFPCQPELDVASTHFIPVAFSGFAGKPSSASRSGRGRLFGDARWIGARTMLRHWLGPLTLNKAAKLADRHIRNIQPDLIHAMRIPYEGMLAAKANPTAPLLITIWGNDFTLHAPSTPLMAQATRRTLTRTDGLLADCQRDIKLAERWGYPQDNPALVLPASGGIRKDIFHPAVSDVSAWSGSLAALSDLIPADAPVLVNPRGFRRYVRNDTFFRSIPAILESHPKAVFLCPAMKGERVAEQWLTRLGIGHAVHLLPQISQKEMAQIYQRAHVTVSVTEHDGTPNTLLEAIACGCFPVAGDLESIREWIEEGENGLLVDPGDPKALADAVHSALSDMTLRDRARAQNQELIVRKAARQKVMVKAVQFYRAFLDDGAR